MNSLVNSKNVERFNKGRKYYVCTICGHHVTLDDSYSNRGRNLICCICLNKISNTTGLRNDEILQLIWK